MVRAPVFRDAVRKPLDPFGEKQKMAVPPLPDHIPAFLPPRVSILQKEVRGKANIHKAGFHLVFTIFLPGDGCVKFVGLCDQVRVHPPFGIALVDVAELTALAIAVTAPPGIPSCHAFPPPVFLDFTILIQDLQIVYAFALS